MSSFKHHHKTLVSVAATLVLWAAMFAITYLLVWVHIWTLMVVGMIPVCFGMAIGPEILDTYLFPEDHVSDGDRY